MNYETKQKLARWFGINLTIVFWLGIAGGCGSLLYNEGRDSRKCEEMFEEVRQISSGNDNIIDNQEKSKLLRDLNIEKSIDETEEITFSPSGYSKINVYGTQGYRSSHYLGTITRSNMNEYIANHREAKK